MVNELFQQGPWSFYKLLTGSENHKGWRIASDGWPLAGIYPLTPDGSPEAEANARLISASPDLYAALKRMVELCDTDTYSDECTAALEQAKAAHATATS